MPRKRLLPGVFLLPLLGAAALTPTAFAAGSQAIEMSTGLRCTEGVSGALLTLTGAVDTTTAPGEPITIRNLTARFKFSTNISTPPSAVSERAFPRLRGFSLGVIGGTTDVTAYAGPARELGVVPIISVGFGSQTYDVSIPSIELPAVAATGDGPLVLRFNSIAVNSNLEGPPGKGDPGDTTSPPNVCTPSRATPTVAVVKSTGVLPDAPTLEPLTEPRGPSEEGYLATLRGTNLTYVKDVQVGATTVRVGAGATVKDDRTIEVRMPGQRSGPKDIEVKVASDFGESGPIPYTYGYNPLLSTVTSVSPRRIPRSAGTFDLVVNGNRLNRARSFQAGNFSGELLSIDQTGTQARIRFRREGYESFPDTDLLEVRVESLDGCYDQYTCFSGNTTADDVRLYEPTTDVPGHPQAPTNVRGTRSGDQVTLTWDAAPGGSVTGYNIYRYTPRTLESKVSADARTATVRLSSTQFGNPFFVRAVDAAGNQSVLGDPVIVAGDEVPTLVPDPPQFTAERGTDPTTAVLTFGDPYARNYEIFLDGTKVLTIYGYYPVFPSGPRYLEDLTPAEHRIEARAFDVAGYVSAPSAPAVIPALDCDDCDDVAVDYAVKGAATIKTLARGAAPLSGSLTGGTFVRGSGDFSADLALAPASVRLTAFGFLTVTAKMAIVTSSKVTGTLTGDALKATVKARVKLPSVSLFGIPLAGGTTCQTRSISTIELTSTGAFTAQGGGKLDGKFPISDLSGCGVLNGIVSPLTAGTNNTISLALSPR